MIARYSGVCPVTGQEIVPGVTEIERVNDRWVVAMAAHPEAQPEFNAAGVARFEVFGLDRSGQWQPASYETAYDAWFRILTHTYGHDHIADGFDWLFAPAGREWVSHMGMSLRVNWVPEPAN